MASVVRDFTIEAPHSTEQPFVSGAQQYIPSGVRRIGAFPIEQSRYPYPSDAPPKYAVAIIDSGVNVSHPDLNVVGGINLASYSSPPPDPNNFEDNHGHPKYRIVSRVTSTIRLLTIQITGLRLTLRRPGTASSRRISMGVIPRVQGPVWRLRTLQALFCVT